ncbi:MAG: HisA/HisF-related TIM barrel protein [Hyphomicrobiales bacterium]|nr:HisA/HisF-related TIM barrel protein [Hyphomicrobiales bacterium]
MHVIPVMDVKDGRVVRAAGGDRRAYQPWRSPICPNADPLEAVAGFLRLRPFATLYIADLDAIERRRPQDELLWSINNRYPGIKIWLDSGLTAKQAAERSQNQSWLFHVLGTESMKDDDDTHGLKGHILSLDFRKRGLLGPLDLQFDPALWPENVIVMSLDNVGSKSGPDKTVLAATRSNSPNTRIYAAGGIRNLADLIELQGLGIDGALIATAFHDGTLGRADIDAICGP